MADSHVHFRSRGSYFPASSVRRVPKAWGEEHWIVNKEYCGKKLLLRKNHRCSMHRHEEKDEVFYLQKGRVLLEVGKESYELAPGDFIHIRAGQSHRFTGVEESEIFEFSTTHSEADSFRTELSGHVDRERYERQAALIRSFGTASVLVVGDAMLDAYLSGSVERTSQEAPIPVVRFLSERHVPGGAANAALNVASLGGRASFVGVRGHDGAGERLQALLREGGVRSTFLVDRKRPTTEKKRIVAEGAHQIVRLDYEETSPLAAAMEQRLLRRVEKLLPRHGALLLSDYAKGVFSPSVLRACIALARTQGIPVLLDPKPLDAAYLDAAQGVSLLTPNKKEAFLLAGTSRGSAEEVAHTIMNRLSASVLVTLGAEGMLLARPRAPSAAFPTLAKEVADVSGAGDTVSAALALALAAGGSLEDAADLANRAAGVAVTKVGTATVSPQELLSVL